jgi:hypothetical protein
MSYDIYIGNAEATGMELEETTGQWSAVWHGATVNAVTLPEAPAFAYDEMSAHQNSRHPGYIAWGEFCDKTGLRDLFFREWYGLMSSHPGTFALRPEHLQEVREARERWQGDHPDAAPGFEWSPLHGEKTPDDGIRTRDAILARLLWLEWWMDWALRTCERPAIHNH